MIDGDAGDDEKRPKWIFCICGARSIFAKADLMK
jgi:hypothetical protein